jgi:hypothetical protein
MPGMTKEEQLMQEMAERIVVSTAASVTVGSILKQASNSRVSSPTGELEGFLLDNSLSLDNASLLVHNVGDKDMSTITLAHPDGEDSKEEEEVTGRPLLNPSASGDVEYEDVDGDYILECLNRSAEFENDELATKTLYSIYRIIEKNRDEHCSKGGKRVIAEVLRAPTCLFRVLHTFLKSVSVQNTGLWVLRNMTYEEADVDRFCEAGICDIVYSQLQEYVYNDEVFTHAIDYAAYMCSQYEKFCSTAGSMGYCKILMSTMSRIVVSNWQLMCACCMYARVLAIEHVDNLCKSGVAGQIMKFLIAHKKEPEIVHICGETILALTELDSDAAMACVGSHKHLRLYVHIIKVNYHTPRIANVMSNVLVSLCGHRKGATVAADIEKSGIVVDLVNVLRHTITSRKPAAGSVLHTSLLLIVHMMCHVSTFETIFAYADGEALLRGLMGYEDEYIERSNSIRDVALAGLQHISTPSNLSKRPGVSMQVLLDGDRIYSYTREHDKHVCAVDSVHYEVDHGPYPGQPEIRGPPALIHRSPPIERDASVNEGMVAGVETSPQPQGDVPPQEEAATADEPVDNMDGNLPPRSFPLPSAPILSERVADQDEASSAEEARDTVPPIPEGFQRDSRLNTPLDRSQSPYEQISPKVLRTLSGNSLLRVLKHVEDSEFIVEKLTEANATKDRVLGLNTLNRALQILSESYRSGSSSASRSTSRSESRSPSRSASRSPSPRRDMGAAEPPSASSVSLKNMLADNLSVVLNFVENMPNDADILLVVAAVLLKLPISPANAEQYVANGIFHTVYSVLQNHIEDTDAFVSWAKFATKLVKLSKSNRQVAGRNQGCQVVNTLLHASLASESRKVVALLGYISAMCVDCPKNQGLFARTGIGSTIVKYLIDNKKDIEVVKKSIVAIDGLCSGNIELNLKVLASQRHIRLYIHILKANAADTLVVQIICGLLMTLSSGDSEYVNSELEMGQDKLVADLVSVLQDAASTQLEDATGFNDDRLQALLAVFSHWATDIRVLRTALVQSSDFLPALQLFRSPPWSVSTMQIVSELVRYFEAFH